jgi:hypothetical protein
MRPILKLQIPLSVFLASLLCLGFPTIGKAASASTQSWTATKLSQIPVNQLPAEYGTPQQQPMACLAWEDGVYISRDGLSLYADYFQGDLLKIVLDAASPCLYYTYERGPGIGQDFTVPTGVCNPVPSAWLHADVAVSRRSATTQAFPNWSLSALTTQYYDVGGAVGIQNSADPSQFDLFAYTDDHTSTVKIMLLRNVSWNLAPDSAGTELPSNVDEIGYDQDNPHIERYDSSSPNSLVLFYDSDNKPGAGVLGSGARYIWYSTSSDGGTTWTNPANVSTINTSSGYFAQPHLYFDGTIWWLYFSKTNPVDGKYAIYRDRQGTPGNWDSWQNDQLVVSAGTTAGVGEPTLTSYGDLSFVVVTHNLSGTATDLYDADPWLLPKWTPTPTPSSTPSPGVSFSSTPAASLSPSISPTATPIVFSTETTTPLAAPSASPSMTPHTPSTPTFSPTQGILASATPSATQTARTSPTATGSPTSTQSPVGTSDAFPVSTPSTDTPPLLLQALPFPDPWSARGQANVKILTNGWTGPLELRLYSVSFRCVLSKTWQNGLAPGWNTLSFPLDASLAKGVYFGEIIVGKTTRSFAVAILP